MGKSIFVKDVTIPWIEVSDIELFLVEMYLNGRDLLSTYDYNINAELELINCLANTIGSGVNEVSLIPAGRNTLSVIEIC